MKTNYESRVRQVPFSSERVYDSLSDFNRLQQLKDSLHDDRLQGVEFSDDTLSFSAPMVGTISLRVVERVKPERVMLQSENSPLPFAFQILLSAVDATSCELRLAMSADLNPFVRGMVGGKLQDALEKMADVLAALDYDRQITVN